MSTDRAGLRWPLWSWRNLIVSCLAAFALLFAVGQAMAGPSARPSSPISDKPSSEVSPTAAQSTPQSRPAATTGPADASPPVAAPATNGLAAVNDLLIAWPVPPTRPTPAILAPYVTASLLASLGGDGVAQLPFMRTYGPPIPGARTPTSEAFSVATDAGRLTIRAAKLDGGWLVDGIVAEDPVPVAPLPSIGPTRGKP